ncbi:MAG TPA: putative collagen-binding domain-containing protein, partial [Thermoanaerobaculia bacterium]|nr:putative collagen-binding domain-containing protein [Thermoanaerobaculia bacterium]
ALAAPGSAYVFYLYGGGTVRVDLREASGPLQAEWYDPRDGSSRPLPAASGGKVETFNAPSTDDRVLYLHKEHQAPSSGGAGGTSSGSGVCPGGAGRVRS